MDARRFATQKLKNILGDLQGMTLHFAVWTFMVPGFSYDAFESLPKVKTPIWLQTLVETTFSLKSIAEPTHGL